MTIESDQSKSQRRKNLRAPLIVLNNVNEDGSRTFFGYGKNVSRGGLFIGSVNPRALGARFRLEIPLPAPLPTVQCECEVVWNREFSKKSLHEPGMGLRFLNLSEETAELIDQWVKEQTQG